MFDSSIPIHIRDGGVSAKGFKDGSFVLEECVLYQQRHASFLERNYSPSRLFCGAIHDTLHISVRSVTGLAVNQGLTKAPDPISSPGVRVTVLD